jgi:hypothetical protein
LWVCTPPLFLCFLCPWFRTPRAPNMCNVFFLVYYMLHPPPLCILCLESKAPNARNTFFSFVVCLTPPPHSSLFLMYRVQSS